MKIPHWIFLFITASYLTSACVADSSTPNIIPTESPTQTKVVETETAAQSGIEAENVISFDEIGITIGFNYPENFNQGASTSVIPFAEPNAPFDLPYPQHARILFTSYTNENESILADGIRVFRAEEIIALEAGVTENLFAVLSDQLDHYFDFPRLPGAASVIDGQLATGNFRNGKGFRFLNLKSFNTSSLQGTKVFYLYQGITDDEKYFLSVIFSVEATFLADLVNVPLSTPEEFETYFQTVKNRIDTAPPADFQPPLTMLDALVSSIVISKK